MSATQKRCMSKGETIMQKLRRENKKPCPIITDPQGCYTGRPLEIYEQPVQDVDDLE